LHAHSTLIFVYFDAVLIIIVIAVQDDASNGDGDSEGQQSISRIGFIMRTGREVKRTTRIGLSKKSVRGSQHNVEWKDGKKCGKYFSFHW
jgi:hypothetical protein